MKINKLIEEIELDYLIHNGKSLDDNKKLLPLEKPNEIKALIWNLLTSNRWRSKISYKDYCQIVDNLFNRLSK